MNVSARPFDARFSADLMALGVFEKSPLPPSAKPLDDLLGGQIGDAVKSKEFEGKKGQSMLLRGKTPWKRLLLLGLGPQKDFDGEKAREFSGKAANYAAGAKLKKLALTLPGDSLRFAQAVVEGAVLSGYRFDKYKTDKDERHPGPDELFLLCSPHELSRVKAAAAFGETLARVQNQARAVLNEPANVMTPTAIAKAASEMARKHGLSCRVYGKEELKKMGMNSFLSVARGSVEPPAFVFLEKKGPGKPIALVGKGITFDSGGISIKPAKDMDLMKFDKAGAIAVMATLQAAAELKLSHHLIGVMALTENLPSGSASKPGDIVVARSGKSVEILNTDAEGRLVLADALAFACEHDPRLVVDLATLTGAVVVALGEQAAGILGNDEKLMKQLEEAGQATGEKLWPLPLWPEYEEQVKSEFADVKNIGANGAAGTIAGAAFLKAFVKPGIPWAHLDIAGTAWLTHEKAYLAKGGTGFGIRLLVEFLQKHKP